MQTKKKILVVARQEMLLCCSSLSRLLANEESFSVDFAETSEIPSSTLAFVDLIILATAGAALTTATHALTHSSDTKLLLLVEAGTKISPRHLKDFHADGAISACSTYLEVVEAINTLVFRKLKYLSPLLIDDFANPASAESWSCLSPKELDVALFITNGKRNVEIATEMNISPKTVSSYKLRIYRKLGITNSAQLVKLRFCDSSPSQG